MTETVDPYRTPQAEVQDVPRATRVRPLAGRAARLGAVLLDGVFSIVSIAPGGLLALALGEDMLPLGIVVMAVGFLALFIYQLVLLHQNGWTLGKKFVGIRIVRTDHGDAGLGRIFALRMLVPGLIGAIPIAGPIFSLADPLFIFGEKRRCIHDYIADTVVIEA